MLFSKEQIDQTIERSLHVGVQCTKLQRPEAKIYKL